MLQEYDAQGNPIDEAGNKIQLDKAGNPIAIEVDEKGNEYDTATGLPIKGGGIVEQLRRGAYEAVQQIGQGVGWATKQVGIDSDLAKSIEEFGTEGIGPESPLQKLNAFEQAARMAVPSMGLPLLAGAAGMAFGLPVVPAAILAKTISGVQAGIFGLSQAAQTAKTAEEAGKPVSWEPYATGGIEAAGEYLGTKYFTKMLSPLVTGAARTAKETLMPTIGKFVKELAFKTAPVEILTEMGQNYFEAQVEKQTGIRPEASPWEEAKAAIAPTAILTAAGGGYARTAQTIYSGYVADVLGDPSVDRQTRERYVGMIYQTLSEGDKENNTQVAPIWAKYAMGRIERRQSIDIDMVLDAEAIKAETIIGKQAADLGMQDFTEARENVIKGTVPDVFKPFYAGQEPTAPTGPAIEGQTEAQKAVGPIKPLLFRDLKISPLEAKQTTEEALSTLEVKAKEQGKLEPHEIVQMQDLRRLLEMPEERKETGVDDEIMYLVGRTRSMINNEEAPVGIKNEMKNELMSMVKWYGETYPDKTGRLMLRNKLLDITHEGRFEQDTHGGDYQSTLAAYRQFKEAKGGVFPTGEPIEQARMLTEKTAKTFPVEAREIIDKRLANAAMMWGQEKWQKNKAFALTEASMNRIMQELKAAGMDYSQEDVIGYLSTVKNGVQTGVPYLGKQGQYELEYEVDNPPPKATDKGRNQFTDWIAKEVKERGKFTTKSLKEHFDAITPAMTMRFGGGTRDFTESLFERMGVEKGVVDISPGGYIDVAPGTTEGDLTGEFWSRWQKVEAGRKEGVPYEAWRKGRDEEIAMRLEAEKAKEETAPPSEEFPPEGENISDEEFAARHEIIIERARALGKDVEREIKGYIDEGMAPDNLEDILSTLESESEQYATVKGTKNIKQLFTEKEMMEILSRSAQDRLEKDRERKRLKAEQAGFDSVDEMESVLENERRHRMATKDKFWFSHELEERKERVYKPSAPALMGIAKAYASAEEFENDWGRAYPTPLAAVNAAIKRILAKYETSIDKVRTKQEKIITDATDLKTLQSLLMQEEIMLKALWAIPGNMDFKEFWRDVQIGLPLNPKAGYSEHSLNKYFMKPDNKLSEDIFTQAKKEQEPEGNVMTVNQFLNKRWTTFVEDQLQNMEYGLRQTARDMEEFSEELTPEEKGQLELFSLIRQGKIRKDFLSEKEIKSRFVNWSVKKLTAEEIANLPENIRAKVNDIEAGYRLIHHNNPRLQALLLNAGEIAINPTVFEKTYKRKYAGEMAASYFKVIDRDSIIRLTKEADLSHLDHEILHYVARYLLTDKEYNYLHQMYPTEEDLAEAYQAWNPQTEPNTMFQKIIRFFRNLARWFTKSQFKHDIFESIRSGSVFQREPSERRETGEQYAITKDGARREGIAEELYETRLRLAYGDPGPIDPKINYTDPVGYLDEQYAVQGTLPFAQDTKQVLLTENMPLNAGKLISSWLSMLGMKEHRLILGDMGGLQDRINKEGTIKLGGYEVNKEEIQRVLFSMIFKNSWGSTHTFNNLSFPAHSIILSTDAMDSLNRGTPFSMELLAHEFSHVIMDDVMMKIEPKVFLEIYDKYEKESLEAQIGIYTKEWLRKLPPASSIKQRIQLAEEGKSLSVPVNQTYVEYAYGWNEWFAREASKWLISSKTPSTAIEKEFDKAGKLLRRFYERVGTQTDKSPEQLLAGYLDDITNPAYEENQPGYLSEQYAVKYMNDHPEDNLRIVRGIITKENLDIPMTWIEDHYGKIRIQGMWTDKPENYKEEPEKYALTKENFPTALEWFSNRLKNEYEDAKKIRDRWYQHTWKDYKEGTEMARKGENTFASAKERYEFAKARMESLNELKSVMVKEGPEKAYEAVQKLPAWKTNLEEAARYLKRQGQRKELEKYAIKQIVNAPLFADLESGRYDKQGSLFDLRKPIINKVIEPPEETLIRMAMPRWLYATKPGTWENGKYFKATKANERYQVNGYLNPLYVIMDKTGEYKSSMPITNGKNVTVGENKFAFDELPLIAEERGHDSVIVVSPEEIAKGELIDAAIFLLPAGMNKLQNSDVKWAKDHPTLFEAPEDVKYAVQNAERSLLDEPSMAPADRSFWANARGLVGKYFIHEKKDLEYWESHVANPFFLGKKHPFINEAVGTERARGEARNYLIQEYLKQIPSFMHLEGEQLKKVEKALIEGDRELPNRLRELKGDAAAELKRMKGYSDQELLDRFGLDAVGIKAYRETRNMFDALHEHWLQQIEDKTLSIYRSKKWYGLLKAIFGELPSEDLKLYAKGLGKAFSAWKDTLTAAKIPLRNLLHTPDSLRNIGIRIEDILFKAMERTEGMTEEDARKIIDRAIEKIKKFAKLNAPEMNQEQINKLVKDYVKKYEETKRALEGVRELLLNHLAAAEEMTPEAYKLQLNEGDPASKKWEYIINQDLRELIGAYGKSRPWMRELSNMRNKLNEWIAYFPRERDDSKMNFIHVYRDVKDEDGNIVLDDKGKPMKETLYLNYYDIGAIGGIKVRKEVENYIKEKGWTDAKVEEGRNIKQPYSTYFKVSDMNIQRVIDNAINSMKLNQNIDENVARQLRHSLLQSVSDELNQRGFGKHKLRRNMSFDEDGKIRTILGYRETGLKNVAMNYITGYAGLETKQEAAMKFTELLSRIPKELPGIREYVHDYAHGVLRNQERIDRVNGFVRSLAFVYYLGGSMKAAFVQLTQNYVTAIPFLAQRIKAITGKAGLEAEKRYHKAMWDVARSKNQTEDEKTFLDELLVKGVAVDQYIQEITGKLAGPAGHLWRRFVSIMAYPFSQMEIFNRKSAGLAAYRLYRDVGYATWGGKLESPAGREAEDFINQTHYLMGKANLPRSMWGAGAGSQALRATYTFRSFTHNYLLSLVPRYGGDARTALHSLAYLVLLGGIGAFPFAKDIFDWWQRLFGEDILGDARKELRKVGGETLARGSVNGLVGLMLGDISGSLSIGVPFLGEPTDTIYGVWGGAGRKIRNAIDAGGRKEWWRMAEEFSPEALANVMRSLRVSDVGKDLLGLPGHVTTRHGRPIFDENGKPITMSEIQVAKKILGFVPVEYSEAMREERTTKQIENYFQTKRQDIMDTYRVAKEYHRPGALGDVIREIKKFNAERISKKATRLVPALTLSNVLKSARGTPTATQKREVAYKKTMD